MSTEVAINHIAIRSIRNMKEDDAGGGNAGGRNEFKKLKRKSDESIEIGGKKVKKQWKTMRRKKLPKWKKIPKKPRSLDGDNPASETKKVTTTTAPPTSGKRKRRMTESFNAPFNSTQFLMNDHKTEAVRHLDSTLNGGLGAGQEVNVDDEDSVDITIEERPLRRITRARESSFSIDSDDDYYYSSPEDEEEFMSREFIKDYDNLRNDRLIDMSKDELINEYLQMEDKIEALEKRLSRNSSNSSQPDQQEDNSTNKDDNDNGSKEAMADTIRQFQKEIQRLETENDQLKQAVKISPSAAAAEPSQHRVRSAASSCSSCSESDDDSTESESDDSDSESESDSDSAAEDYSENENIESGNAAARAEIQIQVFDKIIIEKQKLSLREDEEVEGDTGYESGHSNKPVTTNNGGGLEEGIDPNEEKEVVINTADADSNENNQESPQSESETCPELISVNCITSTSP